MNMRKQLILYKRTKDSNNYRNTTSQATHVVDKVLAYIHEENILIVPIGPFEHIHFHQYYNLNRMTIMMSSLVPLVQSHPSCFMNMLPKLGPSDLP